jgi:hypothetical protein
MLYAYVLLLTSLQSPVTLTVADGAVSQPQVAIAATEQGAEVYVAFVRDGRQVAVRTLRPDGSFAEEVSIAGAVTIAGMRRGPRVAAAVGSVCVSAIVFDREHGRVGELMAWRSRDSGRTFEGPYAVSDAPGAAREGLHDMAVASDGTLGCAWLDLRSGRTEVVASFSRDGGSTWTPNARVYRSPDGSVCECCAPSVAFDQKGRLLVLFRNALAGRRDMWLAIGVPDGFTKAEKLGEESWSLAACPMAPGALAPDAGDAFTLWPREDRIFRCAQGEKEEEVGRGGEVAAATGAGGMWAVWIGTGSDLPLLLLRPGARAPEKLASAAHWPALASAPGAASPLALVWEDHSSERAALRLQYFATATGAPGPLKNPGPPSADAEGEFLE